MINDSFIKLPRKDVIKMCEDIMDFISTERLKKDEAYINAHMNNLNNNWARKLFREPIVTFDEAKKSCPRREGIVIFDYPSEYAWKRFDAAKRVLRAATAASDYIYISSSDLESINP